MNDDFTKYYNIKTRREKHINPFEKPEKKNIESYNQIINYPRKEYFSKLKYRYPSLEKFEYKYPINFNINLRAPIYEDNNFYKKKNLNLSVSMKNIDINKNNDKKKYERILPSFTIPNHRRIIDQMREDEEKESKRLEKNYYVFRKEVKKQGGDTTEKFFSSISKNILKNNRMYIRNMKGAFNNSKKENNDFFLTEDENYNKIQFLSKVIKSDKKETKENRTYINNGRDILLNKSFKLKNRKSEINLVDPKKDQNFQDIIKTEKVVKRILAIPNYKIF